MVEYTVLIIDDDIWMQRILSKTFASYGFKKAVFASNGFDGIGKAVEFKPHIIVLDILMPELSGHLTLKVLKHIKATKDLPVIMVSALSDVENLGKAVKSGTAGFISKPFTRATIYEKLLDIFGKEKLDLIVKGKPISDSSLGYFSEEDLGFDFSSLKSKKKDSSENIKSYADYDDDFNFNAPVKRDSDKKGSVFPMDEDILSNHYQEDEKKSIDSIKKLLLKKDAENNEDDDDDEYV